MAVQKGLPRYHFIVFFDRANFKKKEETIVSVVSIVSMEEKTRAYG
jgi:hypothetical protein